MRAAVTTTVLVLVLVVAVLAFRGEIMLEWIERPLIYAPSHDTAQPLTAFGPGAEEVRFGEQQGLHGVFVPAVPGQSAPTPTLVFFHGNGGNLTHRASLMARFRTVLGANVFIFDYQGYGQSRGRPSETATAADARAALAYLRSRADVDPARISYYGESLGGAVAIELASVEPPTTLTVQSSFTSIADMTRLHYPYLGFLLPLASTRYDSLSIIGRIEAPLLLIHGGADTLIPVDHSRRLLDVANGPKRLLTVPGANHNDVFLHGGPALLRDIRDHVTGHAPPAR